jgi:hypothetical protein
MVGVFIFYIRGDFMHIQTSDMEKMSLGFGDYSCNWGTHIAGLYESEEERDDIINGFLCEGVKRGEVNLYAPAERTKENFISVFSSSCDECCGNVEESVQIYSARELYYPSGVFSPHEMDKGLNDFYEATLEKGENNIRATAEMVWALDAIPGKELLMVYESRLNYFIPDKSWISICLYNINKFSGRQIMGVLQTHPFTISKGVITENPYFIDPDTWLSENAPEYLNI